MMSCMVAPRDVLETESGVLKGDDDDIATVDLDLQEENSSNSTTRKLIPIENFNFSSTWAKMKETIQESRIPLRTACAAITLLTVGIVLLCVGFVSSVEGHGLSHVFLGLIAFIPGSYATFQLYGAYRGWRGYEFQNLPSYEIA